jgi:hypothetical protein
MRTPWLLGSLLLLPVAVLADAAGAGTDHLWRQPDVVTFADPSGEVSSLEPVLARWVRVRAD